jgi:hypothetical protein
MFYSLKNWMKSPLLELGKILPRDIKRALFMVSVFLAVKKAEKPSHELVRKINDLLTKAKVHSKQNIITLELSSVLTHYIWRRFDENGVVVDGQQYTIEDLTSMSAGSEKVTAVGAALINQTPMWLRYGSVELMVRDLFTVLMGQKLSH